MKRGTTTFLKIALYIIGFVALIICIFWFPSLAANAAEMNPEFAYLRYPVLFGLYVTTIPAYLAMYESLELLRYIESNNAFSEFAVSSLKQIKYCAFAIIILYIIGMLFLAVQNALHPGIAIIGITIIFAAVSISVFAAVLQELLKSAWHIKSENDLTV
ncbi:DUF2975 domain-containing protein [Paenisporosarcina sp. TG20]|uniref:DUF2975 domain-containing protein n=1 Tax=Paenisporosarcina sp. TG20 TaxID=1211706 RepID=UPI0002EFB78B|nr:DUF2975 domain-containing protein [Paenisporosarcina sp. TG20]